MGGIAMKDFHHRSVYSVREAATLLAKQMGRAKLNAGGTDLLGLLKDHIVPGYPELIVDLKRIKDLDYIREDREGLRIGALARLKAIAESPLIREKYRILAQAAESVANPQIRNMGTVGGNLAQEVRCWYYRYPDQLGGTVMCLRKGGGLCNALIGDNRYHSIFGASALETYPCASYCPGGTDIPSYMSEVRNGNFMEAAKILTSFNPMPAITGRVCPAFCEPECKRREFDKPVAVRCVERALGDYTLENMTEIFPSPEMESGKSITIIGSGPAGLSAAYYLRKRGHGVTVYEKLPEPGGMLRYSIPSYRLPKDVVRKQIRALQHMGIVFRTGTCLGDDFTVEGLASCSDAVLIATGAWKEKPQTVKGNAPVYSGLEFLKKVNMGERTIPGKKVAVIGGGNVAIDVARTLLKLGAKPIVIYRRGRKEMPAFRDELEKAMEAGVVFRFLTLPVEVSETNSKVALGCVKMKLGPVDESGRRRPVVKPGSDFSLSLDAVMTAIGEEPDTEVLSGEFRKKASDRYSGHHLGRNIFRAGDFMSGSSTVIEAVTSGRVAAREIDLSFAGATQVEPRKPAQFVVPSFLTHDRVSEADLPVSGKSGLEDEERQGIGIPDAEREAGRCFNCGCVAVNPSDIGTALLALEGKIVTTKRNIEASDFFAPNATAPTVLDADEVIREILVPDAPDGARQQYVKFTLRKPIDFALISVGSVISIDNGVCTDARIALGAVAPGPFRARVAEESLIGRPITEETAAEAAELAVSGAVPLRNNAYKVRITKTLVKKAIMDCAVNDSRDSI
jgi:NADPH-dependent glutamate synthase beta subunit-like oxidoreductase/CO/xanthine dehydrogenase FAD-binding subunit